MVLEKENDISFCDIISDRMMMAFQLKHGIVMKAKYMKDRIKGVMVVKSENKV